MWNDAKLVFEGDGYICDNKHKHARKKWENLPLIVTSNRLPYILSDLARDSADEQDRIDYWAFQNRIKFHKLIITHENTEKFPYTVEDLAQYLLDRVMYFKADELLNDEEVEIRSGSKSQSASIY